MKWNKIALLILIPLLLEVVVACCDCSDPVLFNYTNCGVELNNIDNSGEEPIETDSDTINKDAFGINVAITVSETTCQKSNSNSLFFQSAYAFSCDCEPELQYLPLDSILEIKLYTVNDFDAGHLGNSEVTELFQVFTDNIYLSIEDYLPRLDNILYYSLDPSKFTFNILLMTPPSLGDEQQFEVEIELTDGRFLNAQTDVLSLY